MAAPVVTLLLLQPGPGARYLAFVVFVTAALSDLWDGRMARARGQVTPLGKILDPIADKLLIGCTIIPVYVVNATQPPGIPVLGVIPLWVVLVLLGRELLITVLRFLAVGRGRVVEAITLGKRKALAQNIFAGACILWIAFSSPLFLAPSGWAWQAFSVFHAWFLFVFLSLAILLTVASAVPYIHACSRILLGQYR